MTSHSSQGQTAERVLIHVDAELSVRILLNSRNAYVSVVQATTRRSSPAIAKRSIHHRKQRSHMFARGSFEEQVICRGFFFAIVTGRQYFASDKAELFVASIAGGYR
jgi:hypothetical protein